MPFADFLEHIKDPSPGFVCHLPLDAPGEWTARVTNKLNPPATSESIALLRRLLGQFVAEPFEALYRPHDGLRLYEDRNLKYVKLHPKHEAVPYRTAGVEFYPVEAWEARSKSVLEDKFDWLEEDLESLQGSCVVFGEVCHSANYFAVRIEEPGSGNIIYLDHDPGLDGPFAPIGADLEEVLDRIVADPARFLADMGEFARYHDGRTEKQWIPTVYHPNLDCS